MDYRHPIGLFVMVCPHKGIVEWKGIFMRGALSRSYHEKGGWNNGIAFDNLAA